MARRLFVTLAVLASALFAQAQTKDALWLLHNRQYGCYLCTDGTLTESPDTKSALWRIIAGEGEPVKIVNASSGQNLLKMETEWTYGGFDFDTKLNAGWYTLSSVGDASSVLCIKDGVAVLSRTNRVEDFSCHWTFVRVGSEEIPYTITPNSVTESSFLGKRCARAVSATEIQSNYHGPDTWKLSADISSFPKFSAQDNLLVPALYNMALEESLLDIRPQDGTFMAGKLWPDTWTRDIVYSIYFAYSWLFPEVSRKTLEKQTLKNPSEALQDTGSGGSYPISTDRVVWAVAAWEYYLATGDKKWLEEAYEGLSYTARKDLHIAYDKNIHLFKGETCSMDWRTHTYPFWFTNTIIGESYSSGTNALHLFLYTFLSRSSRILKKPVEESSLWANIEAELREGINTAFWDDTQNLYKCWLYPEYTGYLRSEKVGDMSNGLAIMLGAADADKAERIIENYPMYAYGASVLYPSKPDGYAYHNKSIWPVWQTPLMYAAHRAGNHAVTLHLVNSAVRAGAMFLTHKENMTYDTGYDRNTALNSDRQLWSVASFLSIVYRVFFGMEMTAEGLCFKPFVPEYLGREIKLEGFKYRKATLNIKVVGSGSDVAMLKVNGKKKSLSYQLPASAKGKYNIEITLKNSPVKGKANVVPSGPGNCWAPVEPVIRLENNEIHWSFVPGCIYSLVGDGVRIDNIHAPYDISKLPDGYYSVVATNGRGFESDLSNPVLKTAWTTSCPVGVKDFRESHEDFSIDVDLPAPGDYVLWFEGANGRGPHDVYCAVRSVFVDGKDISTAILSAEGDWSMYTLSNHMVLRGLTSGKHQVSIRLNPEGMGYDNNMSFNRDNHNDWIVRQMNIAKIR